MEKGNYDFAVLLNVFYNGFSIQQPRSRLFISWWKKIQN